MGGTFAVGTGTRTAREVLRVEPTAAVARRRRTSTLADANKGPGRRRLGASKSAALRVAAADPIAVPELDEEMAFEVSMLLDQYDLLERQIGEAEVHLASLLDGELARRLRTIPGVGAATSAALIAEIGDIWRFDDVDQLLAYAGVRPYLKDAWRRPTVTDRRNSAGVSGTTKQTREGEGGRSERGSASLTHLRFRLRSVLENVTGPPKVWPVV